MKNLKSSIRSTPMTRRSALAMGLGASALALLPRSAQASSLTLRYGHNNEPASVAGAQAGRFAEPLAQASGVDIAVHVEFGRGLEGPVGGLYFDSVVDLDVDAGIGERFSGDFERRQPGYAGIAEQGDAPHVKCPRVRAEFGQHADSELYLRRIDCKGGVAAGRRGEIFG